MSKVSQGEMIAAAGGVLLIISLFLDWFSGAAVQIGTVTVSSSGNAFDVFSAMDIIMLLVGVAAVGLAGAAAMDAAGSVPSNAAWILALLGVGAIGWTLGYDLETANAGIGAWLGLVASIAIAFGGFEASASARPVPAHAGAATAAPPPEPTASAGSTGPPPS